MLGCLWRTKCHSFGWVAYELTPDFGQLRRRAMVIYRNKKFVIVATNHLTLGGGRGRFLHIFSRKIKRGHDIVNLETRCAGLVWCAGLSSRCEISVLFGTLMIGPERSGFFSPEGAGWWQGFCVLPQSAIFANACLITWRCSSSVPINCIFNKHYWKFLENHCLHRQFCHGFMQIRSQKSVPVLQTRLYALTLALPRGALVTNSPSLSPGIADLIFPDFHKPRSARNPLGKHKVYFRAIKLKKRTFGQIFVKFTTKNNRTKAKVQLPALSSQLFSISQWDSRPESVSQDGIP